MQKKHAIIVGAFIIVGIAILVVLVFTLGGQRNTFEQKTTLRAIFDDVNGLQEGGNIWFSGVKIGTIKKIRLQGNSVVEVTLSVDKNAIQFIHRDARVKLSTDGLIGNKILVIYGGTPTAPVVQQNDYLSPQKLAGTDEMMATLQESNKNLVDITNNLKKVAKNIADGTGTIGALINDKALFEEMQASITQLHSALGNLDTTSIKTKLFMNNLAGLGVALSNQSSSLNRLIKDTTMYTAVSSGTAKFSAAATSVASFADSLRAEGNKLTQSNNAVGVLLNDPQTAGQVRTIMANLQSSSHKLDEDLEALQHNFLFRGFFRKKEKQQADSTANKH